MFLEPQTSSDWFLAPWLDAFPLVAHTRNKHSVWWDLTRVYYYASPKSLSIVPVGGSSLVLEENLPGPVILLLTLMWQAVQTLRSNKTHLTSEIKRILVRDINQHLKFHSHWDFCSPSPAKAELAFQWSVSAHLWSPPTYMGGSEGGGRAGRFSGEVASSSLGLLRSWSGDFLSCVLHSHPWTPASFSRISHTSSRLVHCPSHTHWTTPSNPGSADRAHLALPLGG